VIVFFISVNNSRRFFIPSFLYNGKLEKKSTYHIPFKILFRSDRRKCGRNRIGIIIFYTDKYTNNIPKIIIYFMDGNDVIVIL
jgi:hypothetical protein